MEMTNNLCDSCTNIECIFQSGIVRTECAFYMPPYIESDNCGNYVVMQPTVEAIPKADYETRLKADMVAMLTEIQLEIEELEVPLLYLAEDYEGGVLDCKKIIQQKINALKGGEE